MHYAVMMMTYCFLCLKKYNQKTKETFSLVERLKETEALNLRFYKVECVDTINTV